MVLGMKEKGWMETEGMRSRVEVMKTAQSPKYNVIWSRLMCGWKNKHTCSWVSKKLKHINV